MYGSMWSIENVENGVGKGLPKNAECLSCIFQISHNLSDCKLDSEIRSRRILIIRKNFNEKIIKNYTKF